MNKLEALKELEGKILEDKFAWRLRQDADLPETITYGAFEGSLDAAKALHEAVLSGCIWRLTPNRCVIMDVHGCLASVRNADNPARAWLLAIIRALIAIEEEKQ